MHALASRFPAPHLTRMLLGRGALFWLLMRAMLLVVGLGGGGTPAVSGLNPLAAFVLILTVGALGVLESRRLNEHRFFANLGVSPVTTGVLGAVPAVLGEAIVAMVTRP